MEAKAMEIKAVNKWNIGTKIWFGFYILLQWVMFIEYATKPITAYNTAYQQMTVVYGVVGLIGTCLILWLAISHRKAALITMLVVAGVNAAVILLQGEVASAATSLILPGINWLITHNHVE